MGEFPKVMSGRCSLRIQMQQRAVVNSQGQPTATSSSNFQFTRPQNPFYGVSSNIDGKAGQDLENLSQNVGSSGLTQALCSIHSLKGGRPGGVGSANWVPGFSECPKV